MASAENMEKWKFCKILYTLSLNLYISYSEKKNNIFHKIFQPFAFINYIILYNKNYAKIHYEFYNYYKCHHRNKITYLLKKIVTYLLNCNKRIEKNIRDNDSRDATKQLLK